jgi:prepilin-type processing-associated H-X9-DG protein
MTLMEVLVVIAILGLLLGIAIPAVQRARESSRRVACVNNLSQIGKALQEFEGARREYPRALDDETPQNPSRVASDKSVHLRLLPYLEQSALAENYGSLGTAGAYWDPQMLVWGHENVYVTLEVFLCPSDGHRAGDRPATNYRACTGNGPYGSLHHPDEAEGIFMPWDKVTPASVRDGLAYTIAFSEKITGEGNPLSYSRQRDAWYSNAFLFHGSLPQADLMAGYCDSLTGQPPNFHPYGGGAWHWSGQAYTWYNHVVGPNSPIPDCSVNGGSVQAGIPHPPRMVIGITGTNGGVYKASSFHPGGVNCLFADGHVAFVANQVDLPLWRALATRAGAETVDLSSL